jgi:hypothetical protein
MTGQSQPSELNRRSVENGNLQRGLVSVALRPGLAFPEVAVHSAGWSEAYQPAGTLAEDYLAHRRLSLPKEPVIRFHPRCPCGDDRMPAMVALMSDPATGEPLVSTALSCAAMASARYRG